MEYHWLSINTNGWSTRVTWTSLIQLWSTLKGHFLEQQISTEHRCCSVDFIQNNDCQRWTPNFSRRWKNQRSTKLFQSFSKSPSDKTTRSIFSIIVQVDTILLAIGFGFAEWISEFSLMGLNIWYTRDLTGSTRAKIMEKHEFQHRYKSNLKTFTVTVNKHDICCRKNNCDSPIDYSFRKNPPNWDLGGTN